MKVGAVHSSGTTYWARIFLHEETLYGNKELQGYVCNALRVRLRVLALYPKQVKIQQTVVGVSLYMEDDTEAGLDKAMTAGVNILKHLCLETLIKEMEQ